MAGARTALGLIPPGENGQHIAPEDMICLMLSHCRFFSFEGHVRQQERERVAPPADVFKLRVQFSRACDAALDAALPIVYKK
jgi:hypothetical protein